MLNTVSDWQIEEHFNLPMLLCVPVLNYNEDKWTQLTKFNVCTCQSYTIRMMNEVLKCVLLLLELTKLKPTCWGSVH